MHIINELSFYHFSGCKFSKLFCVIILQLLLVIIVIVYAWLSGMNFKTLNILREISLGPSCLMYSATLFHFCNYAHYFANTVRYQKILCEDIYMVLFIYVTVYKVSHEVSEQNIAST